MHQADSSYSHLYSIANNFNILERYKSRCLMSSWADFAQQSYSPYRDGLSLQKVSGSILEKACPLFLQVTALRLGREPPHKSSCTELINKLKIPPAISYLRLDSLVENATHSRTQAATDSVQLLSPKSTRTKRRLYV